MKKILYIFFGITIAFAGTVYAVQISVPSANGSGFLLQSTSTGQYLPVSLTAGTNITISTTTSNITINATGGGGSGGGSWSTTTSSVSGQLINYPNNNTDIVTIGSNATTSAEYWFDPNTLNALIGNSITASTTIMGNATTTGSLSTQYLRSFGIATSTFGGDILMVHPYFLTTHGLRGDASDGLTIVSNNYTQVANLGAGGGSNATFYGGVNIDGQTRLATSLNGLLKASSGTISAGANGTDYTLITATTCSGTDKVSAIDASGNITCSADQTGGGGTFPFTVNSWGNSTTSTLGFLNGFISTASSTIVGNATTTGSHSATNLYASGNLGVGTQSPVEKAQLKCTSGYCTLRIDSGAVYGGIFTLDSDGSFNVGGLSSGSVLNFLNNNAIGGTLYNPTSQGTIFQVNAPSGSPQEATLTTKRDFGSGNFQGADWTNEDFGVDAFTSINSFASGTKAVLPILLRGWTQSCGQIHVCGKPWAFFDPSGATALGTYASTTYDKTIPLQVASSTASIVFAVDGSAGTHKLTVSNLGTIQNAGNINAYTSGTIGSGAFYFIQDVGGTGVQTGCYNGATFCKTYLDGGPLLLNTRAVNNVAVGTSTTAYPFNSYSSTGPQLTLSAGAGLPQWSFRNAGGNLYVSTTTVAGTSTTSPSVIEITSATTTVRNVITEKTFVIGDGTNAITTGVYAGVQVPYNAKVVEWSLFSDDATPTSCSIVVDLWKDTYANFPPTVADSMTASAKPTLSSATKNFGGTDTWNQVITEGDYIRPNVDSVTSCTRITLKLKLISQ